MVNPNYDLYVKKDSNITHKYDGIDKVNLKHKNGDYLGKYYIYEDDNVIYEKDIYLNKNIGIYILTKVKFIGGIVLFFILAILILKRKKKLR